MPMVIILYNVMWQRLIVEAAGISQVLYLPGVAAATAKAHALTRVKMVARIMMPQLQNQNQNQSQRQLQHLLVTMMTMMATTTMTMKIPPRPSQPPLEAS